MGDVQRLLPPSQLQLSVVGAVDAFNEQRLINGYILSNEKWLSTVNRGLSGNYGGHCFVRASDFDLSPCRPSRTDRVDVIDYSGSRDPAANVLYLHFAGQRGDLVEALCLKLCTTYICWVVCAPLPKKLAGGMGGHKCRIESITYRRLPTGEIV
ncbi:hypothetical protein GJ744_012175 [Endocarpon pusillum]|uniref:Uncharacterized protein n=1 Tax=Endocarpon pusillum TaxID=364733 RepID=A0A8H7AJC6_9EURO|nr:hypothetical protein GJ744_012175 [Endocarpon pusillum]